jgi:hypothetical protein
MPKPPDFARQAHFHLGEWSSEVRRTTRSHLPAFIFRRGPTRENVAIAAAMIPKSRQHNEAATHAVFLSRGNSSLVFWLHQ